MTEIIRITKDTLNIPESLDKYYRDQGWQRDYWMEIPLNWELLPDEDLKRYPITSEIVKWRMCNR